jgi:hypothetical protein
MKDHLSIVSVLLLLFYMGWFMWDQKELLRQQNDRIKQLEGELIIKEILLNSIIQEQEQYPMYRKAI